MHFIFNKNLFLHYNNTQNYFYLESERNLKFNININTL